MKATSMDRFFVKSLALVSLLSLAQLTLTAGRKSKISCLLTPFINTFAISFPFSLSVLTVWLHKGIIV